jgi:hypothetical protein
VLTHGSFLVAHNEFFLRLASSLRDTEIVETKPLQLPSTQAEKLDQVELLLHPLGQL